MSLIVENFSSNSHRSRAWTAVLSTLIYFDIFSHPVKKEELFLLAHDEVPEPVDLEAAAAELHALDVIQQQDGYYFLHHKSGIIARRTHGEEKARSVMAKAIRYSKRISRFPFVRAVALSGSLSKNFMDEKSDVDYFIITAKNRMWVARTLLVLYKKIFLLNSHKFFCVNYFVTENNLEIPDKNIFTATEISFLIPTYNDSLLSEFDKANGWTKTFLPNFPLRGKEHLVKPEKFILKTILEKLLSGKAGEILDSYFFRATLRYWKKKFSHFDPSTFDFRLRSRKNVSKHHPLGFQEKVLDAYSKNLKEFMRNHHEKLHAESPVYS